MEYVWFRGLRFNGSIGYMRVTATDRVVDGVFTESGDLCLESSLQEITDNEILAPEWANA